MRSKRGQALVEMGLMAPVLFMLVLGASDLSRLFYYSTAITNAAREGARHGAYYDPMATPAGNSFANDAAVYNAATAEASYLNLSEPCHPNSTCTGGLTNCPTYPYSASFYPAVSSGPNSGYVFVCFNNSTTATTASVGQPIRVTILYSFQPVTPIIGSVIYSAASTEILAQGNS